MPLSLEFSAPGRPNFRLPTNQTEILRHLEPESQSPIGIVYFGESPKRETLLRHVARETGLTFRRLPGGQEDNNLSSAEIASAKIGYGLREELPRIIRSSRRTRVAIAGDVTILVQTLRRDGNIDWDRLGKPEHPRADFQEVLRNMIRTVETTGDHSYFSYCIDAASESRLIQGLEEKRQPVVANHFINVALKEDAVRYFATDQGTQEYLDASRKLLESSLHRNGLEGHQRSSPADACAAFEIAIWEMFKAISSIDGKGRSNRRFKYKLLTAFKAAYHGIDPEVVAQVHPDAPRLVAQWNWPDQVMNAVRAA